jgi:membrane protein implicated in regulation of membrane protease activity
MELMANGNGWLIFGLILIILEMIINVGYVSISFGVGLMVTGLLIKLNLLPSAFDESLVNELLVAGITSLFVLVLMRKFFKANSPDDINTY